MFNFNSPVVQWSSIIRSGRVDPGSNPGRAMKTTYGFLSHTFPLDTEKQLSSLPSPKLHP